MMVSATAAGLRLRAAHELPVLDLHHGCFGVGDGEVVSVGGVLAGVIDWHLSFIPFQAEKPWCDLLQTATCTGAFLCLGDGLPYRGGYASNTGSRASSGRSCSWMTLMP